METYKAIGKLKLCKLDECMEDYGVVEPNFTRDKDWSANKKGDLTRKMLLADMRSAEKIAHDHDLKETDFPNFAKNNYRKSKKKHGLMDILGFRSSVIEIRGTLSQQACVLKNNTISRQASSIFNFASQATVALEKRLKKNLIARLLSFFHLEKVFFPINQAYCSEHPVAIYYERARVIARKMANFDVDQTALLNELGYFIDNMEDFFLSAWNDRSIDNQSAKDLFTLKTKLVRLHKKAFFEAENATIAKKSTVLSKSLRHLERSIVLAIFLTVRPDIRRTLDGKDRALNSSDFCASFLDEKSDGLRFLDGSTGKDYRKTAFALFMRVILSDIFGDKKHLFLSGGLHAIGEKWKKRGRGYSSIELYARAKAVSWRKSEYSKLLTFFVKSSPDMFKEFLACLLGKEEKESAKDGKERLFWALSSDSGVDGLFFKCWILKKAKIYFPMFLS